MASFVNRWLKTTDVAVSQAVVFIAKAHGKESTIANTAEVFGQHIPATAGECSCFSHSREDIVSVHTFIAQF